MICIQSLNYQFLDIRQAMESGLNCSFENIIVSGGGAQNEFWIQNKADMLGLPIHVSNVQEATPLGAAMLAGLGIGIYSNLDDACERVNKPGKIYQPDLKLTAQYQSLFAIYKSIYPALKPVSHALFDKFKSS